MAEWQQVRRRYACRACALGDEKAQIISHSNSSIEWNLHRLEGRADLSRCECCGAELLKLEAANSKEKELR